MRAQIAEYSLELEFLYLVFDLATLALFFFHLDYLTSCVNSFDFFLFEVGE